MIDHMLEGRFLFGIGPGGLRSDMEMMGNLERDRNAMFVESINQILAMWSGNAPYNIEGKFWNITTAQTMNAMVAIISTGWNRKAEDTSRCTSEWWMRCTFHSIELPCKQR
jgi:hypothetical protein